MGGSIIRAKRSEFDAIRKKEVQSINSRYKDTETRNVVIVGPIQSGKTQLFRQLINQPFSTEYEQEETAKIGYQVISTVKSRYENLPPMALHVTDAPGQHMRHQRCAEAYFGQADVVLIAVDVSLVLDQQKIDSTSQFVLEQVTRWHDYTTDASIVPPLILHVFTKQDRINQEVRKLNDKMLKTLARNGVIGNFLYVSAKTGEGLAELRQAIFDCDIKGHGEKIFPHTYKKKVDKDAAKKSRKSLAHVVDSDDEEDAKKNGGLPLALIQMHKAEHELEEEKLAEKDGKDVGSGLAVHPVPFKGRRGKAALQADQLQRIVGAQGSNVSAPATVNFQSGKF